MTDKAAFVVRIGDARHSQSIGFVHEIPKAERLEICVLGRSNVGKSTLINALLQRHGLAHTSRTPGRTRLVNFFDVTVLHEADKKLIHVVDLPGYGFAKGPADDKKRMSTLISAYLANRHMIRAALLLLDARHQPSDDDIEVFGKLQRAGHRVIVVATKEDKIAKSHRAQSHRVLSQALDNSVVIGTSAAKGEGLDKLWSVLWPLLAESEQVAIP